MLRLTHPQTTNRAILRREERPDPLRNANGQTLDDARREDLLRYHRQLLRRQQRLLVERRFAEVGHHLSHVVGAPLCVAAFLLLLIAWWAFIVEHRIPVWPVIGIVAGNVFLMWGTLTLEDWQRVNQLSLHDLYFQIKQAEKRLSSVTPEGTLTP